MEEGNCLGLIRPHWLSPLTMDDPFGSGRGSIVRGH